MEIAIILTIVIGYFINWLLFNTGRSGMAADKKEEGLNLPARAIMFAVLIVPYGMVILLLLAVIIAIIVMALQFFYKLVVKGEL